MCAWVVAVYVFGGGRCMVVTDVLISGLCGGGDGCFGSAGRVVSVMPCRSCRVGHVVSLVSCRVVSLVSHRRRKPTCEYRNSTRRDGIHRLHEHCQLCHRM